MDAISNKTGAPQLDFCASIVANPDISGRGVRISIYAGTVLNLLVSVIGSDKQTISDGCRNTLLTCAALVISAIIEWKTQGLSLFDGVIVTMLAAMAPMGIGVNTIHHPALGFTVNFSNLLAFTFMVYWAIQVWQDPATFVMPLNGEICTASIETVFVMFGHNIKMTNRGLRGFTIGYFSLWAITVLIYLFITIKWLIYHVKLALGGPVDSVPWKLKYYLDPSRKVMRRAKLFTTFALLGPVIYMIITIEQVADRNNTQAQLNNWSFGQTLALITLLPQLMNFLSLCGEAYRGRKISESPRAQAETPTPMATLPKHKHPNALDPDVEATEKSSDHKDV
ncbi:unnamed protein product [Rhizoctonia solani]|uniref:Uncharacterized protein n=1 Tax=Rhizoctonia solani TaxID=456999 RepID=A0A8H3GHD5_9AGAM|nr:unnamed protein product [Rhizoctonia solani]